MIKGKSGYSKDDQCDQHGWYRCVHHITDMGKERRIRCR